MARFARIAGRVLLGLLGLLIAVPLGAVFLLLLLRLADGSFVRFRLVGLCIGWIGYTFWRSRRNDHE